MRGHATYVSTKLLNETPHNPPKKEKKRKKIIECKKPKLNPEQRKCKQKIRASCLKKKEKPLSESDLVEQIICSIKIKGCL
jgi:hypothetical protein